MNKNAPDYSADDDWERVYTVFEKCRRLPPGERKKYLDQIARDQPGVKEEVVSLLQSSDDAAWLDRPLCSALIEAVGARDTGVSLPPSANLPPLPAKPFQPIIVGKHTLLRKLGEGGMAEVFLAKSKGPGEFEKIFAIKRVHREYSDDPEFRKLFEYEARLGSALSHPNIVHIYDFDIIEGNYFLSMEYVAGWNLAQIWRNLRKTNTAMPRDLALFTAFEICKGLGYAHSRRDEKTGKSLAIVHRDVTPKNIMISREGMVKILDFGIAKQSDQTRITRTGALRGTMNYLAPELAEGRQADRRSDLFSVGVILYELLSSQRLFEERDILIAMRQIQECVLPGKKVLELDLPEAIRKILLTAMARDPVKRFQTAESMGEEIEAFLKRHSEGAAGRRLGAFLSGLERESGQDPRNSNEVGSGSAIASPVPPDISLGEISLVSLASKPLARWRSTQFRPVAPSGRGVLVFRIFVAVCGCWLAWKGWALLPHASPVLSQAPPVAERDLSSASQSPPAPRPGESCLLQVESQPAGAMFALDGIALGRTPATVNLRCGVGVDLALTLPGYRNEKRHFMPELRKNALMLVLNRAPFGPPK